MLQQISVFAENRPGKLEKITRVLAAAGINIRAVTISDLGDFGVVKLLVDQPQKGFDLLRAAGLAAKLVEVVAVPIADQVGGLDKAAHVLCSRSINIKHAYGFVSQKGRQAVLLFEVDQPAAAAEAFEVAGQKPLSEAELADL